MKKRKVLVLCRENSCRSIMAEGLINTYMSHCWEAFSAGSEPTQVNPHAITVMKEIGIDVSGYHSKSMKEFLNRDDLDLVITVCDEARMYCPTFLKPIPTIHVNIEDPGTYSNLPDEEALPAFRRIRDQVKKEIFAVLDDVREES